MVVALGGNALGKTPKEQLQLVKATAEVLADLVEQGHELIISHGNGRQVGMLNLGMEYAADDGIAPYIPLPECDALTQGYIGYHLQQALQNVFAKRGIKKDCVTLVTQVVVREDDPGFENPTKPIGSFYTKAQADAIAKSRGYIFKEDSGRGFRRVVASPRPVRIVELEMIRSLTEQNAVVIACGGGGIPVLEKESGLEGVSAVIDKDSVSSLMALGLEADRLLILTAVDLSLCHKNCPFCAYQDKGGHPSPRRRR
jgi:carbamate kinase